MTGIRARQIRPISVDVHTAGGAGPTLVIAGEVDISTVAQVETALTSVLADSPATIAFDLAGVIFMDSSGLAILVKAARHAQVSINPSPQVRRLLEVTGLTSTLSLA